jgi:hypothetical protein
MSKVVILWFNFSTSTSYPHGPVSSGFSLYTADLVDKDIGHQHSICNCGDLKKRSINVTNRRNTYLNIKNIRTHDGRSAVNELLNIEIFYRLLKQTLKEHYNQTFEFEGQNMAVFIDESERFDDLKILESFKVKLCEFYQFDAPVDMERVSEKTEEKEEVDTIPFINKEDDNINKFTRWVSSVCPSM